MPKRPPQTPPVSAEDRELFREAVADARPIPPDDRIPPAKPRMSARARSREADEKAVMEELTAAMPDGELETGDELHWAIEGVQRTVMRKLKRGQYRVEAELDLHGYTSTEAKPAVAVFIHEARSRGQQCVRIIHGKGRGSKSGQSILKQLVGGWLRRHEGILAYVSARPSDGGTGALIVLLRRLS